MTTTKHRTRKVRETHSDIRTQRKINEQNDNMRGVRNVGEGEGCFEQETRGKS